MILDERTEFADSATVATGVLGDVVDLFGTAYRAAQDGGTGAAAPAAQRRDIGAGHPIYWVVVVESVGTGTATLSLITADAAALTGNPITLATVVADLTVTTPQKFAVTLPIGVLYRQYLGVSVAGTVGTSKISSFLVLDVSAWRTYLDAVN
jgi:hypothetical protein